MASAIAIEETSKVLHLNVNFSNLDTPPECNFLGIKELHIPASSPIRFLGIVLLSGSFRFDRLAPYAR
jgi:hypothetical protein